jgi:hypothetical protein
MKEFGSYYSARTGRIMKPEAHDQAALLFGVLPSHESILLIAGLFE